MKEEEGYGTQFWWTKKVLITKANEITAEYFWIKFNKTVYIRDEPVALQMILNSSTHQPHIL